ncbi:MAG: hypothetical protein ACXWWO_05055, partial [Candidatus Limnocylindria bacterium]
MSGPWDRPPRPDPDQEWPAEDMDQARGGDPDQSSGSSQAQQGVPSPSTDWDDWPPITPGADYGADEPLAPSSDPWAEAWD